MLQYMRPGGSRSVHEECTNLADGATVFEDRLVAGYVMQFLLFEDDHVASLAPATSIRPAYGIRCGGTTLRELLQDAGIGVVGAVRPHLTGVQSLDPGIGSTDERSVRSVRVLLNARMAPSAHAVSRIIAIAQGAQPCSAWIDNQLAFAVIAQPLGNSAPWTQDDLHRACRSLTAVEPDCHLLQRPHEIIAQSQELLADNLEHRIRSGHYQQVWEGVFVPKHCDASVTLTEPVVTDTRRGPIVLESNVTVGPFSQLTGPLHLDQGTQVQPHAHLVGPLCTGRLVKIGGEVEASVIEDFTNKKHFGYVGHSYLGQFVNLGAGTTTSNLKNTYGEVRVKYGRMKIPTGMQFLGGMVGDYSRSAIQTGIFTGKTVGVSSILYGLVTEDVGSFINHASQLGDRSEVSLDVALRTQDRVFARRGLVQLAQHRRLLEWAYQATADERVELVEAPPSL